MRLLSSRFLSLAAAAALSLALAEKSRADDSSVLTDAVSAAQAWLAEIDAGKYPQCYDDGGSALHQKMTQDMWVKILMTERPPMGKVVSRTEIVRTRHPDGLEGSPGDFVIVGYRTSFENRADELEYVVVKHEFGGWRGVGYDFGPEQTESDGDADGGPTTVTETSTNTPPVPTNGVVVPAKRSH